MVLASGFEWVVVVVLWKKNVEMLMERQVIWKERHQIPARVGPIREIR